MENHYETIKCISKLNLRSNYKVYRNGTITLDLWDGTTIPQIDKSIHIGNNLSIWFQLSGTTGLLCHIMTREKDINKIQQLLIDDITHNDVIFDSNIHDVNTKLVSMYIFIDDNISRPGAIAKLSALSMNTVMNNVKNLSDELVDTFNIWNSTGKNIKIFKATQEPLNRMKTTYKTLLLGDESGNSINYGKIMCIIHTPNFVSNLPNEKEFTTI